MFGAFAAAMLLMQAAASAAVGGDTASAIIETRTIEQIYQAALAEGGIVTCWHGGDETNQQDDLKKAFETRFPGMTLNVTVDLSKYHDGNLDSQIAASSVYVDSIILQTLHDYPRWAQEGALLKYAPLGFDQIYPKFKDSGSSAWYALRMFFWQFVWNTEKLPGVVISEFSDLLKPEFRNKVVLTYPNDDDAVLYAFDLVLQKLGNSWLDALLQQQPHWVRGTATPATILLQANETWAITFTSGMGLSAGAGYNISFPTQANFVSWPQTGAILKDAPHPEGAKLLHAYMLSKEFQERDGWSVRQDVGAPNGTAYPDIANMPSTDPAAFLPWMEDRAKVERLRFLFEDRIGTAQGPSPLIDNL